jgi:hypothetical protein
MAGFSKAAIGRRMAGNGSPPTPPQFGKKKKAKPGENPAEEAAEIKAALGSMGQ